MTHSESELREALIEAAEAIRAETGRSAWAVFEEGAQPQSHAVGLFEGAALALGLTPLEVLDELGLRNE
ncbi:MAG: hypothetical protein IT378_04820 [Sandaracinaceae bacterium]|nr:hypothetical protein [Sandaracinaceae bacterium]